MTHARWAQRPVAYPPKRISAWLTDIEDWDSSDADVFMDTLRSREQSPDASPESPSAFSVV
jgi:hypothetical protein